MKRNSGFDEHAILRRLPIRVRDRLMLYHYQVRALNSLFRHLSRSYPGPI